MHHPALRRLVLPLALLIAVLSGADAQDESPVIWEIFGERFTDFGSALLSVEDLDGDDVRDLLVGAPGVLHEGADEGLGSGAVHVLSGKTGEIFETWKPTENSGGWGATLQLVGDIDQDGQPDVFVGSNLRVEIVSVQPHVRILSVERERRNNLHGSERAFSLGDINGDSIPDFVRTEPRYSLPEGGLEEGRVVAHDSATGRVIWQKTGDSILEELGFGATLVRDYDGDSIAELVVSSPGNCVPFSTCERPRLHLYSGRTGNTLASVTLPMTLEGFGRHILKHPDSLGHPDTILVASPNAGRSGLNRFGWIGFFRAPDLLLQEETWGLNARNIGIHGDELGRVLTTIGDVDFDGIQEVLATTRQGNAGGPSNTHMIVRSGKTLETLQVYETRQSDIAAYFGSASRLGDIDADGREEFVIVTGEHIDAQSGQNVLQSVRFEHDRPALRRGDPDGDGRPTVSDAVATLRAWLDGDPDEPCPARFDHNSDGVVSLADGLGLLFYVFDPFARSPQRPAFECGRLGRILPRRFRRPLLPCSADSNCN